MDSNLTQFTNMPNPRRFLICGDIHGDEMHEPSVKALLSFCKDYQPDVVINLGDNWNFKSLRKKASEEERAESLMDDWEMGKDFFEKLFSFGSEKYFLRGNHDERMWHAMASHNGAVADFAGAMVKRIEELCRKYKVKMLPYDSRSGVLKIGHLQVLHGYHHGMNACSSHARIYGNCVFGHIHSIESLQVPGLEMKESRSIGCLCTVNPDYMSTKTAKLRWAHGWAYGLLHSDGTYSIYQTREINGKFHAAQTIKAY